MTQIVIIQILSAKIHFLNHHFLWRSLNFSEVSTLKEIFGIATDGRSTSCLINRFLPY